MSIRFDRCTVTCTSEVHRREWKVEQKKMVEALPLIDY